MKLKSTFNRSIFIDSSNIEEIIKWDDIGIIDGVTTNQYIFLKEGIKIKNVKNLLKNICQVMKGKPVSVELTDSQSSVKEMLLEAKQLNNIAENIVIKVPLIPNTDKSLIVIKNLIKNKISVNVTAMMTFEQLILAILATRYSSKPSFVSLFWGRTIDDHAKYRSRSDFMAKYPFVGIESEINSNPHNIIEATANFIREGNYQNPKIIVGSIRTASMVGEAFAAGSHIVTVTPQVLSAMLFSQRTIETINQFDDAWKQLQSKK